MQRHSCLRSSERYEKPTVEEKTLPGTSVAEPMVPSDRRLSRSSSSVPSSRAVCLGRGGEFVCPSLDVTERLSLTFYLAAHFISDKTIQRQTEAISVALSLDMACVRLRQCTARGQTASSYLGSLYDKALMEQLLVLTHISVNKVHQSRNDFLCSQTPDKVETPVFVQAPAKTDP